MTGLEITLFILGTAFIIISFFIVDNSEKTPKNVTESALNADAFEQLRSDFVENSTREADIILHQTEDKLENVSNDKIIAVGEYSDQVLEKINSNHKEVVFLYQMLNDKEEELKAATTQMDNVRIECEKMLKEAKSFRDEAASEVEAVTAKLAKAAAAPVAVSPAPVQKVVAQKPAVQKTSAQPKNQTAAKTQALAKPQTKVAAAGSTKTAVKTAVAAPAGTAVRSTATRTVKPAPVPEAPASLASMSADSGAAGGNRNDEIIALHKSGKSVMEISKLLGMGQGEVKLIIDLYS